MKQRFSSLDVRVIAHELSTSLVTLRLANIYDLSSRIFLLKFAKPDHREQFIIDSGFRCHLTDFGRATATTPSPFVARLRKFLRTRRVTAVEQVGTDRVLEIRFSDGAYRLFLEFYAGGNIVLTDNELTILALLRSVNEGEEHEQYRQGLKYNLSLRQNYEGVPPLTKERLRVGLQKAAEKQAAEAQKAGKKIKRKPGDSLRKALAVTTTEFPPILIDHALHVSQFDRTLQPEDVIGSESLLDELLHALSEAQNVVQEITSKEITRGYILAKQASSAQDADDSEEKNNSQNILYDDFHAFKPAQLAEDSSIVFLEHEGFNSTVDEFFSSIEGQKVNARLQEREDQAKRKIENARQEQSKRLDGLQQVQELNVRKAQAIEANVERVDEAVAAVNGLIAQGMDWVDIGRLIENEQKRHNAVAEMIKLPLKLHENTITLMLAELDNFDDEEMTNETDSDSSDAEDDSATGSSKPTPKAEDKRLAIDVDLAVSAWSNARQYYDQKRTAAVKQEKTAQASQKALKSTEQKVMADLKKGLKQEKDVLRQVRKQFWFEKFIYFISSDGYLVLAGRDIQQSEILYRRYLKKGDAYVHAELPGAASVIIKNRDGMPEAPIPPSTLSQAGSLSVCTSNAWESKAIMSAWWVNADQVSKTAATGEYLAAGDFSIRGQKNFLPPAQLLLGFAVMFRISEDSKQRHAKHRVQEPDNTTQAAELSDKGATAESSAPQNGQEGQSEDDDDFSDAQIASTAGAADTEDDDDFPDAPRDAVITDDEFPDARSATHDDRHEEDEDKVYRSVNPLQSGSHDQANRGRNKNASGEGDGEENDSTDDEDEEDENDDDEAEEQAEKQRSQTEGRAGGQEIFAEAQALTTDVHALDDPGKPSSTSGAEAGPETTQLSNKERKAQNRAEQGKPVEPAAKPSKQHLKGKKGKARKAAAKYAKYALQDDEEREIAMRLLGSKTVKDKQEAEVKAQETKSESVEEARARRKAQHDKTQREGLEAEEKRRKLFLTGEGADDSDDDMDEGSHNLVQLDELVGTPLPGDEILEAIPVCAPWTALSKYKYKAKMQPGQQKKGKATREIVGKWTKDGSDPKKVDQQSSDIERIWPREIELLKTWKEAEIVGIIPVKQVRVMMSGGTSEKSKGGHGGKSGRGGKGSKRR